MFGSHVSTADRRRGVKCVPARRPRASEQDAGEPCTNEQERRRRRQGLKAWFGQPCAVLAPVMVVASLVSISPASRAQSPDAPLPADATLLRLIQESLSARSELLKSQAIVRAEEERVAQAGAFPDPMLQIGIQNDGFTSIEIGRMGTSFVSFMASQTFPWPGKLGLEREVAQLGASQAKEIVARVRLSTEADVRRAYLDLLLFRDRQALLDQVEAIWQKSFGIARVRYEAGSGAQSDVLRAQLEQNRIKQRRFALQAEERSRVQGINRLRSHPLDEPIETPTHIRDLPALATLDGRFSGRVPAGSPELAAARLGMGRADRSVALAEKSYYPDLTVAAGIMVRGALPPMWLVTVGGPSRCSRGADRTARSPRTAHWRAPQEARL